MAPIEEIFCEIDDFCTVFFPQFERGLLPSPNAKRQRALTFLNQFLTKLHSRTPLSPWQAQVMFVKCSQTILETGKLVAHRRFIAMIIRR